MGSNFRLKGKLLILRFSRLGHVPPGWYATELLNEADIPLVVLEFSSEYRGLTEVSGTLPRFRLGPSPWVAALPGPLRVLGTLFSVMSFLASRYRAKDVPALTIAHGLQEQLVPWVLKRLFGTRYAVHVHEVYDLHEVTGLAKLFLRFEGPVLRGASFLIFPERKRAEIYAKRYQLKNRIHVVYNCPRLRRDETAPRRDLRRELSIPENHLIVGYMGGIGRTNALVELIEGAALVPETTLLFWGWADETYRAEILATAEARGMQHRVRLLGQVEDKWGHLKGCDALYCVYRDNLLRTRFQATASNKFTEALACGVPVLTHASGGFPDALAVTQAGIAVGELSPSAIAVALRGLKDENLRHTLGSNGRQAFLRQFHYEKQFAPVIETVRQLGGLTKTEQSPRLRTARG